MDLGTFLCNFIWIVSFPSVPHPTSAIWSSTFYSHCVCMVLLVSTSLFEDDFAKLYSIFILVKRTVWACFKYGNYGSVRIFQQNLYQIFSSVCMNPSSGFVLSSPLPGRAQGTSGIRLRSNTNCFSCSYPQKCGFFCHFDLFFKVTN